MESKFVEKREGGLLYIAGSRVMLDSIVEDYLNGEEPVAIQTHFETLSLETVAGAIEYYLTNKAEVEAAMAERRRLSDEYEKAHPNPPEIVEKIRRMRESAGSRR